LEARLALRANFVSVPKFTKFTILGCPLALRLDLFHSFEHRVQAGRTEGDVQNDVIHAHVFHLLELGWGWMEEDTGVDREVFRAFSLRLRGAAHALDHATEMFQRNARRVPPAAVVDHAFERLADIAAKENRWMRFLNGLRPNR